MAEILASLNDINGNLDGNTIEADDENTELIQVSVARVVRGYLSTTFTAEELATWASPSATPEWIREAAGKLIASQLYLTKLSQDTPNASENKFAQKLYNEGMAMLADVVSGAVDLPEVTGETTRGSLTLADFHPNDSTDRAFSMGMNI